MPAATKLTDWKQFYPGMNTMVVEVNGSVSFHSGYYASIDLLFNNITNDESSSVKQCKTIKSSSTVKCLQRRTFTSCTPLTLPNTKPSVVIDIRILVSIIAFILSLLLVFNILVCSYINARKRRKNSNLYHGEPASPLNYVQYKPLRLPITNDQQLSTTNAKTVKDSEILIRLVQNEFIV
ncbi:unnamed protein product [Didymodactylos carnosus]|uniref:Uncharacterized protein n=1 Tax=Didymodactylos carnosus TaxID=1234261 RepID=A0A814DY97_9BILA|nr:unnamed protein product [Didymodactylos carnosus]CAF1566414.1 unnamed protein product [Didymodactylos carnosus]CAF3733608.1 unnamed protein product [Didymodactylos carnosus]CAF4359587.1 unnamed protein product [Didymodactylos carnosus]